MERITYRITLDTHKNGIQRTLQGFQAADNMSRRIAISLVSGGDTYDLPADHIVAAMYVTTPNATEPSINNCIIEGNTVIYDALPITEEGITEMQLKLIGTGIGGAESVLISPKFAIEVAESGTDDGSAEENATFTSLENALAKAQEVYDSRLERIEIGEDCSFRVYYADGTIYENYSFQNVIYNRIVQLAKSYAVGGTGARDGEDTDNSMYYASVSESASEKAENAREGSERIYESSKIVQNEISDTAIEVENNAALAESYTHGGTGKREGEDTDNAQYYMEEAKDYAKQAKTFSGIHIASNEIAGVIKPGDNMVEEDGTFRQLKTVKGSSLVLNNSYKGALRINKTFGKSTQDGVPTPEAPVPIVSVGDSGSIEINVYDAELSEDTKQSLTINTPNGLPGIEVADASLANYIDADGKMWCCDERDWARGVDVKRIQRANILDDYTDIIASTDHNWYDADLSYCYELKNSPVSLLDDVLGLCSHFETYSFGDFYNKGIEMGIMASKSGYSVVTISKELGICTALDEFKSWCTDNNVTVARVLATPIETPIPEEELAAWRALQANEPTTTILSDADVEVEYPTSRVGTVALDADMRSKENKQDIKELARNIVFIDGRPTSANINPADYKANSMVVMQATTLMTDGKPPVDGFIITNIWDSVEYATQTCYSQDDDKIYRRRYVSGVWDEKWGCVAMEGEVLPLTGGTLTGNLSTNGGVFASGGIYGGALNLRNGYGAITVDRSCTTISNSAFNGSDYSEAEENGNSLPIIETRLKVSNPTDGNPDPNSWLCLETYEEYGVEGETNNYSIFGEHNKPFGTLYGLSTSNYIGGTGKALLLWNIDFSYYEDGYIITDNACYPLSGPSFLDTTYKIHFYNGYLRIDEEYYAELNSYVSELAEYNYLVL